MNHIRNERMRLEYLHLLYIHIIYICINMHVCLLFVYVYI